MAAVYKTPGVYVEEISKFPPSIAPVATAVPAFVGYTEKAVKGGESLRNRPTKITSLLEYERFFGSAPAEEHLEVSIVQTTDGGGNVTDESISAGFASGETHSPNIMYYAMQAYFENGGGDCYVVSVGDYATPTLSALQGGLDALRNEDEPTLIVFPEAQSLDAGDHHSLINAALDQCADLQDRFVIADLNASGEAVSSASDLDAAALAFRNGVTSGNVKYGAAYFPNIHTVFDYAYNDTGVTVSHTVDGGAGAHDGVTIDTLVSTQGELYNKILQALRALPVTLPPSPAIAGVYARVDNARGVWKAPANEGLRGVTRLAYKVTEEMQEDLNVDPTAGKSINAIRAFTGRGILVWGARTLDGNSNEWRYVNVRRFFNFVEESSKKATARFVFEPNDANTWVKVRAMIENFLLLQWRAGALQGAKPEQAFYVKIGLGETMTALDILEGRMIVEIGMAAVRPAEFIILRFSHKRPEA